MKQHKNTIIKDFLSMIPELIKVIQNLANEFLEIRNFAYFFFSESLSFRNEFSHFLSALPVFLVSELVVLSCMDHVWFMECPAWARLGLHDHAWYPVASQHG